jgi:histidinol phosphatase-like enzyme (inositol monophosphatase family)
MTRVPIESLMQAVSEAAALAADFALRHYRTGVAVETKEDGSPVTIADRGAEAAVRAWINERFPGDAVLGEEFGEIRGQTGRRWIIDPIDGTKAFVRGVPLWGSLVAVVEGDTVLAGAASFPAVGESLVAANGCGAWHNGSRAQVSTTSVLSEGTVLITDPRTICAPITAAGWDRLSRAAGVCRSWGDAYGYLLVATGRADVMIDPIANAWDVACFQPIITEAGGVFTDISGAATPFGGHAIATNAALAQEARALLTSTNA